MKNILLNKYWQHACKSDFVSIKVLEQADTSFLGLSFPSISANVWLANLILWPSILFVYIYYVA